MDVTADAVKYECFFFFQAEDGIRDYKVTGVKTCALPIYLRAFFYYQTRRPGHRPGSRNRLRNRQAEPRAHSRGVHSRSGLALRSLFSKYYFQEFSRGLASA